MTSKNNPKRLNKELKEESFNVSFDDLMTKTDAFIDSKPVKKIIVWKREEKETINVFTFDIFVRRQNFGIFANFLEDNTEDRKQTFKVLVESIAKDEDGKENLLTYDKARELHPELAILFLHAINEVNTKKN